eukprot:scaffold3381_cov144-Skeletonema_menzelii.AAC.1
MTCDGVVWRRHARPKWIPISWMIAQKSPLLFAVLYGSNLTPSPLIVGIDYNMMLLFDVLRCFATHR